MTTPLLSLSEVAEGVVNQAAIHNTALRQLEALLVRALSMSTTAPPGSPSAGDSYIIPAGATGAWSGKTNQIAALIGGAWSYFTATEGIRLWINDLDAVFAFDGTAWVEYGGGGSGDVAAAIAAHEAGANPHPGYLTPAEGDAAYDALGAAAAAVAAHEADSDPHPGYLTQTEADARYLQSIGAQPFDATVFYPGVPTASAFIDIEFARTVSFATNFAGSALKGVTAASGTTVVDLYKNGSSIGTATFSASGSSATFSGAAVTFNAGDYMRLTFPASPDATLANIRGVMVGTR